MIERNGNEIEMVCDKLGVHFPETYESDDLESLVEAAKAAGWKITRENGEWNHYSPDVFSAKFEFAQFEDID